MVSYMGSVYSLLFLDIYITLIFAPAWFLPKWEINAVRPASHEVSPRNTLLLILLMHSALHPQAELQSHNVDEDTYNRHTNHTTELDQYYRDSVIRCYKSNTYFQRSYQSKQCNIIWHTYFWSRCSNINVRHHGEWQCLIIKLVLS